jgi:hypothetical protein
MNVPPNDALSLRHRVFVDTMREHGFDIEARPLLVARPVALSWPVQHSPLRPAGPKKAAIAPDDVSGIFRSLREKQLKFVRGAPPKPPPNAGAAYGAAGGDIGGCSEMMMQEADDASADYLRRHTFAAALVDGVQSYSRFIGTPSERARVVARFVGGAVVGMTADVAGLVKRFRKATGTQHHDISEEAMRIALYDTDTLYDDGHLSDIVIFHTAATLKLVIVIVASEEDTTRIFPPDASLRDRALLLLQARDGSFSLEPMSGPSLSSPGTTLLDVLKRIISRDHGAASSASPPVAPLGSMKADELRAFASRRFGLGGRQVAELHGIMRRDVPLPPTRAAAGRVTKAVLREALDLLMAAE